MIVVATDEEYKLAKQRFRGHIIIKTGIGATNVAKSLRFIPKWTKLINFGYAGSNNLAIGKEVKVSTAQLYHPNVEKLIPNFTKKHETIYKLQNGKVPCYTSNDFVLHTDIKKPVVFDMELAYIMALGFKRVESIKIVSDNLSLHEYQKTTEG
jgi:hypothetical protein